MAFYCGHLCMNCTGSEAIGSSLTPGLSILRSKGKGTFRRRSKVSPPGFRMGLKPSPAVPSSARYLPISDAPYIRRRQRLLPVGSVKRGVYFCGNSQIRGTGLILGTEFTDNKSPDDPFPPEWGKSAFLYRVHSIFALFAGSCMRQCPLRWQVWAPSLEPNVRSGGCWFELRGTT